MNLVFLFGPAAAGKLTVARALGRMTGYPVFHNHLIVDAVGAVFPFGSPAFVRLRQEFWLRVFAEAAEAARSVVFTFAPEPTVPIDFVPETQRVVGAAGGTVLFVRLTCSNAEQDRRIENEDRAAFQKLRSCAVLARLRAAAASRAWDGPEDFRIDTEQCAPDESARRIVDRFGLQPAPPHAMYADD